MGKTHKMDLEIIGTARRPNKYDLRHRGLTELPDASPEVMLRRAELELEQAELRKIVGYSGYGTSFSVFRTDLDGGESKGNVRESELEPSSGTESGDGAAEKSWENGRAEEKSVNSNADVDVPNMSASPVVDEAQKSVRIFRDRCPIQVNPYTLEREMYRHSLKAGK